MGSKSKLSHKQLIVAAKDMNKIMGLDPEIELDLAKKDLIEAIKHEAEGYEASEGIDGSEGVLYKDILSEETWNVFDEMGIVQEILDKRDELISSEENENQTQEANMSTPKKQSVKKTSNPDKKKPAENTDEATKVKKPAKKSPAAKGSGSKPGVIVTILSIIEKHQPIHKDDILEKLVKKFPDRLEASMKKTISDNVPSQFKAKKGIILIKDDEKRWSIKKKK